eukprot:SM000113S24058  [mRNA]  locus=s113:258212:261487:+ [translate_table: standard]
MINLRGEAGDSSVRAVGAPEQPRRNGAHRRVQPTPFRDEDACINRGWHSPAATSPAALVQEKHHDQLCDCDYVGVWREMTASAIAPSTSTMSNAQETWRDKRLNIFLQRLLEAESEAHCAQEALESDILSLKSDEVKLELQKQLPQSKLDAAVKKEMDKYVGLWEDHLVNLEERICRYQVEELVNVDELENDPELALALDMEKRHWLTRTQHKTKRKIHQSGICFCNFYIMSKCLQWGPKAEGQLQPRATIDRAITQDMLHSAKVLTEAQGVDHMATMVAALAALQILRISQINSLLRSYVADVLDADSRRMSDGEMEKQEHALF